MTASSRPPNTSRPPSRDAVASAMRRSRPARSKLLPCSRLATRRCRQGCSAMRTRAIVAAGLAWREMLGEQGRKRFGFAHRLFARLGEYRVLHRVGWQHGSIVAGRVRAPEVAFERDVYR